MFRWVLPRSDDAFLVLDRDGIGTKIKLTGRSGLVQFNHATTAVGYASSSDSRAQTSLRIDRSSTRSAG